MLGQQIKTVDGEEESRHGRGGGWDMVTWNVFRELLCKFQVLTV